MAITRREILTAAVAGGLGMCATASAEEKPLTLNAAQLSDAERGRLGDSGPAVVKIFIAELRERMSDEQAGKLRKFIDPRYLKEHGLQEGPFPIRRVVTNDIYNNQLAADPRTALILAGTENAQKECFLFQLTIYESEVYIAPQSPPEKLTKAFTPWILRVKV